MYGRDDDEVKDPHPVLDHPYFAPLADPVKNIVKFTLAPMRGFGSLYADTWRNMREAEDYNLLNAFMDSVAEQDEYVNTIGGISALLGGGAAALAGGVASGAAIASSFGMLSGIGGGFVAAFAFGAAGAMVGPLAAAAVLGTLGLAAGLGIGVVTGFAKGCAKALKHAFAKKETDPDAEPAPAKPKGPGLLSVSLGAVKKWFVRGHAAPDSAPDAEARVMDEPARSAHTSEGALEYLGNLDRDGMRRVYESLRAKFEPAATSAPELKPVEVTLGVGGAFENLRKLGA